MVVLKDVFLVFKVPGMFLKVVIELVMRWDLECFVSMQNCDGGWGFWCKGEWSWFYFSVHVSHVLVRAKVKGFKVLFFMLSSVFCYLKWIEDRFLSEYLEWVWWVILSYVLYVWNVVGDLDAKCVC